MTDESDSILSWKNHGYVILPNLINETLLNSCCNFLENNKEKFVHSDFGSQGKLEFFSNSIIDHLSFNENIIKQCQCLLETNDLLLSQSDTWGKTGKSDYTSQSNNDQRMHMDYGNNTFLHPSEWDKPEAVAVIIYLSDTNETGGSTALVPRNGADDRVYKFPYVNMPGYSNFPFLNDRNSSENYFSETNQPVFNFRNELYKREVKINSNKGDVLFYRLDLWHRGTPVNEGKTRFVTNLIYKKRDCYWIHTWNPGFTKNMYYSHLERFIENLSPLQRSVLGIPLPGDNYWDLEKVYLLKSRYTNMDVSEYMSNLTIKSKY
jgi:hypothetical protein